MLKRIIIYLLVIFSSLPIKAQSNEWRAYNTNNTGLSNNQVLSITIDKNRVKWILMKDNGLVKYDDKTWVYIDLSFSGLPNSCFTTLVLDKYDNKWFGTNGYGLAKYDGNNWVVYNTSNSGIPDNRINAIAFDSLGNIWIGTAENGLVKFDGSTWTVFRKSNSGIPENKVTAIAIDRFNTKWVGTWLWGGVAKYNDTSWFVYNYTNYNLGFIYTIYIDSKNNVWVGHYWGVSRFNKNNWTHYFQTYYPYMRVKTIAEDINSNIWIGYEVDISGSSDYFFAKYYDGQNWIWLSPGNANLPYSWIEVIAVKDSEIYFGTYDKGIAKKNSNEWWGWFIYDKTNTGIINNYVKSLSLDRLGNIWIGTYGSGVVIHKTDKNTTRWRNELPGTHIHSLKVDELNNVWAGTWEKGLRRYNGVSWDTFTTANSGIPSNNILCISNDAKGNKWIGTDNGIGKFDGVSWTVYNQNSSGLPGRYISSIVIDNNDVKWIGTENGLAKFDGTSWTVYNTSNSGLPENIILSLAIDSLGNKWIGTWQYGLVKYNGFDWTIYNTSNSGLLSNRIRVLKVDNNGNIWVGTESAGLVKYDGTNWQVFNVFNSGISGNFITSIEIDKLNHKLIGTNSGLSIYRESGVILNVKEDRVYYPTTKFKLYQNYPNPFNPTTKIQYSIPSNLRIVLKLFDILGKEIALLKDEIKEAGTYELTFNAKDLPSGIYIYQLNAYEGNNLVFKNSKWMMLVK